MLAEKRLFPRHYLDFPVTVLMELPGETRKIESESVCISRNGIQLKGDGELVAAFLGQRDYPQTCVVRFRIPGRDYGFSMDCQLTTHRRLSQHVFHVVLNFTRYHEDCGNLLAEYLNELRPPKVSRPPGAIAHTIGG